jgi:hypothetical protein
MSESSDSQTDLRPAGESLREEKVVPWVKYWFWVVSGQPHFDAAVVRTTADSNRV